MYMTQTKAQAAQAQKRRWGKCGATKHKGHHHHHRHQQQQQHVYTLSVMHWWLVGPLSLVTGC